MSFDEKYENFKNNLDLDINNLTIFFENKEDCETFDKILSVLDKGSPEDDGMIFSYLEGAKAGIRELINSEKGNMRMFYDVLDKHHQDCYFENVTTVMQNNYINVCLYIYRKHFKENKDIDKDIVKKLNEKYLKE
jgi:hypothetical protein